MPGAIKHSRKSTIGIISIRKIKYYGKVFPYKAMVSPLIKHYIAQQRVEQAKILRLAAYDLEGNPLPKRYFYHRIDEYVHHFLHTGREPRWIMISGLRGVGKTTVLAQLFFEHRKNFKDRVLYLSMDEIAGKLNSNLFEALEAYEDLLGESYASLLDNVLLLIDEVHFDPKWQIALKSLYDKSRRVLIICTGSSALAMHRSADTARRSLFEKIFPLKFTEYITLSDTLMGKPRARRAPQIEESLAQALFYSKNANDAYSLLKALEPRVRSYWEEVDSRAIARYIKLYSLPAVLQYSNETEIYKILNDIVDRVVERDLPALKSFSTVILAKVPHLLFLLATSHTKSIHALARDVRHIDEKTLIAILRTLEAAQLVFRVYPYSTSAPKRVRKPSKYLFLASSMRAAIINLVDSRAVDFQYRGILLEDSVGMYLHLYFSDAIGCTIGYDTSRGGADFILDSGNKKIAIEVGWNKNDITQVLRSMQKYKADYGLLVTNTPLVALRQKVVIVPLSYFYLL